MRKNPEFFRNVWQELTPYRLAGMPAVLFALFLLVNLLSDNPARSLSDLSLGIFSVLVLLWGTRLASEAVVSEIRDRTWDSQRMSGIDPWSMTWGKLLGSSIYPWYGGLICLVCYAVISLNTSNLNPGRTVILYLLGGLLANAIALLSSMQAIKKERKFNRSEAASFLVLGILIAGPVISFGMRGPNAVTWFGILFIDKDFFLWSVLAFVSWTVFGIYRLMRSELQMKNGPFAWLAFAVFLSVYAAGFINLPDLMDVLFRRALCAYIVCVGLTYLMAFSERKDRVAFRKLLFLYHRKDWRVFLHHVPAWAITLLPLLISACFLLVFSTGSLNGYRTFVGAGTALAASLLFLVRDLGLLLFFNLARNTKRADWIMVLSLGILYGVVPSILNALNFDEVTALFWPRWDQHFSLSVIGPGLEAFLALLLLVRRWKTGQEYRINPAHDVRG